jgi:hypothetical protein
MDRIIASVVAQRKSFIDTAQGNFMSDDLGCIDETIENEPNALVVKTAHVDVTLGFCGVNVEPFAVNLEEIDGLIAHADAAIHDDLAGKGGAVDGVNHAVAFEKAGNNNVETAANASPRTSRAFLAGSL